MEFWKYSAHGNDFLLIDNRDSSIKTDDVIFWKDVCKRRLGVGADGVIFVENSKKYDFHMRYLNADGGEVAMCGNGTRAISHFYKNNCLSSDQTDFIFSTKSGVYRSIIEGDFVSVEMTEAYDENLIDVSKLFKAHDSFYLNTGVPHCVYLVSDVEAIDVVKNGREIRNNSLFSEGVNINFISKLKDKYAIRTYERGVEDETLSCGTGITAAAHMLFKEISENRITFKSRGGELTVTRVDKSLYYGGKVNLIYKGELCLN